MKGTRPLTAAEIRLVCAAFEGTYEVRNRGLFRLGISCGGRISELLLLKVSDVFQNGTAVTDLLFDSSIVKGKKTARSVPLNTDGRGAIEILIGWHRTHFDRFSSKRWLFPSRQGTQQPMSRKSAHAILKRAFEKAGLNGKVATHSMRKSYAQRMYHETGDIFIVKELLGHADVSTTQAYLGLDYQKVRAASEAINVFSESEKEKQVTAETHEIRNATDDTLIGELQRRGYEVRKGETHP